MQKFNFTAALVLLLVVAISSSSCEAIAGIFKAGVWVGIIIVVVVVGIIFWLVNKAKK